MKYLDEDKSEKQVHGSSAVGWKQRVLGRLRLAKVTGKIKWLVQAKGFADEAVEHAALAKNAQMRGEAERVSALIDRRIDAADAQLAACRGTSRYRERN